LARNNEPETAFLQFLVIFVAMRINITIMNLF